MVLFIDAIKTFVSCCSGVLLQKKISLIFESLIQEDASNKYYGYFDTRKMEQVIRNIILNSVKFTPSEGQIIIQFSHEEEIHPPKTSNAPLKIAPMPEGTCMIGAGSIVVRITDTGVGIDPQSIPKLFGQFDANDLESKFHNNFRFSPTAPPHTPYPFTHPPPPIHTGSYPRTQLWLETLIILFLM